MTNTRQNIKNLKQKGITLIALVVTIIVLLILAGISIMMLTGQNGILKRAGEASDKTGKANVIDQAKLDVMDKQTENYGSISKQELHDILKEYFTNVPEVDDEIWEAYPEGFPTLTATEEYGGYGGIEVGDIYKGILSDVAKKTPPPTDEEGFYVSTSTKDGGAPSYKNPTIPAGFKPVTKSDDPTVGEADWGEEGKAPSEESVNKGLVIEDKDGNQFVWIPVPKAVETVTDGEKKDLTDIMSTPIAENDPKSLGNYKGVLYQSWELSADSKTVEVLLRESPSIYEPEVVEDDATNTDQVTITKEVLQAEYNAMVGSVEKYKGFYIGRYETSYDATSGKAQSQANKVSAKSTDTATKTWYGLYKVQTELYPNVEGAKVASGMIWRSQYCAILNWMARCNININSKTPIDGAIPNAGNITGSEPHDKLNNIYDLLGGKCEWSQAVDYEVSRVYLGDTYSSSYVLWNNRANRPGNSNSKVGSRLYIYIK